METTLLNKISVDSLLRVAEKRNYKVFHSGQKDYDLNLWGVRKTQIDNADVYSDFFVVWWYFNGKWVMKVMSATTHPGRSILLHPENKDGAAILKEGQYLGCWEKGLHLGKYPALRQVKPMTVIRDFDRDDKLDFDSGVLQTGIFYINNHWALTSKNEHPMVVGNSSAGCQVIQDHEEYLDYLENKETSLIDQAIAHWGNSFSYTLINERDFEL